MYIYVYFISYVIIFIYLKENIIYILVGGLEHEFYFPIYWESSSQLTFTFFRGVETTNQYIQYIYIYMQSAEPSVKWTPPYDMTHSNQPPPFTMAVDHFRIFP